jgi:hypothetical protein
MQKPTPWPECGALGDDCDGPVQGSSPMRINPISTTAPPIAPTRIMRVPRLPEEFDEASVTDCTRSEVCSWCSRGVPGFTAPHLSQDREIQCISRPIHPDNAPRSSSWSSSLTAATKDTTQHPTAPHHARHEATQSSLSRQHAHPKRASHTTAPPSSQTVLTRRHRSAHRRCPLTRRHRAQLTDSVSKTRCLFGSGQPSSTLFANRCEERAR